MFFNSKKWAGIFATIGYLLTFLPVTADETVTDGIKRMERSKDVSGLTRLLRHPDGTVRSSAAVSLSNAIRGVKNPEALSLLARTHLDSALRDPFSTVRHHSGRAFQHSIRATKNQSVLRGCVPPLVDVLHGSEVEETRRRFASVMLAELIPMVESRFTLEASSPKLLFAALDDPDEQVREYAGRALVSCLKRIGSKDLLGSAAIRLTKGLAEKDQKRRLFCAVLLSGIVQKLDESTLKRIAEPLQSRLKTERDPRIRDYIGRAARDVGRMLEPDPKSESR